MSSPLDSLPSPLDSIADTRAAARWLIAAAGAVGALLLGGGPLVAATKITSVGHAVWAGVGLLIAVVGVGWAIWQTSEVLVPPVTTVTDIGAELRTRVDADPGYYLGSMASSVDDLLRHRQIAASIAAQLATASESQMAALRKALEVAHTNIRRTDPYLRWLLATAHAWQVRDRLRTARRHTFLAGILVIIGAVVFLAATAHG